jgi:hypothetical protein
MRLPQSFILLALGFLPISMAHGETSIQDVVDALLDAKMQQVNITAAPLADDYNILRRTTLDLIGRIPTSAEVDRYVTSEDSDKREQMVARLLQSPAYQKHLAYDLNLLLSPAGNNELQGYLEQAVTQRRGWDQMFRAMLLGNYEDELERQAMKFVKLRLKDLDNLTNATSSLFFGVNISCAKCHDHPLVLEWTQAHFYGMKSFFNRSFENGGFVGERDYGALKYQTTDGEQLEAHMMFLSGTVIEEPEWTSPDAEQQKAEKKQLAQLAKDKKPVPVPQYSRRAQLLDIALSGDDHSYFSKSIVNRIWYRTFGYGLVMPLDQMHPSNPASHPQLLEFLAQDMSDHGYDLTRLIRGLVLTQAYARSSRYAGETRPPQLWFAVANVKPLTPQQYAAALLFGARNPSHFVNDDAAKTQAEIDSVHAQSRTFAAKFDVPGDEFQVSVDEALLFSNDAALEEDLLANRADRLIGELMTLSTDMAVVATASKSIMNRPATKQEQRVMMKYLKHRQDRREAAVVQLVWAMLTSSEVRFNY